MVEGYVFHDVNTNGLKDGEDGLPTISVTLTGTDIFGNPVNITMDTDADGHYSFIVPDGNYTITYNTSRSTTRRLSGRPPSDTTFTAPIPGED